MSITTDIAALALLGGAVWYLTSKLPDISVESAAAAVDQRDQGTVLGQVQTAVSDAVAKLEAEIRSRQQPRVVAVRQYSFDANKWGD